MKGVRYWTLHLLAGLILFFLLAIHFGVFHLDYILGYKEVLSYESMMMRAKQVFYLILYLVVLSAALYHGLYGFRKIVFELSIGKALERLLTLGVILFGFFAFIYGAYIAIKAFLMV